MRTIEEIVHDLSRAIPDEFLYVRNQGGVELTYISWHGAVRLLDRYAPGWSGRITQTQVLGERLVLTYSLTIPTSEGVVIRDATGSEQIGVTKYGDPSSNAESMAFRRAASKFGLGLYLYNKAKDTSSQAPFKRQTASYARRDTRSYEEDF